jgi:hypothetical protein
MSDYASDGYILIPHLLDPGETAALKVEALAVMAAHAGSHSVLVGASVVSRRFHALGGDQRILALLAPLMPDGIAFLSDKVVVKTPAIRFATPWHADAAYWPGTRPKLSVWIALDDATADNGALRVLPGSHRRDWSHRAGGKIATNGDFDHVVDPDWDPAAEVVAACPAGGALVFSDRLLHASTPNRSGADRVTIISTYHAPGPDEPFDLTFAARRTLAVPANV